MNVATDWIAEVVRELPSLATAEEAARALRTSPRNLRRMIAAGRIVAVRSRDSGSSRVLVPRSAIASYLASCAGVDEPTSRVKVVPRRGARS